jgi:tungstate transport system substrate-binding protein
VILVNPARHPHVKKELGQAFIDWLVSPEGQKAIADYKIGGAQLFYPNANDPSRDPRQRGSATDRFSGIPII